MSAPVLAENSSWRPLRYHPHQAAVWSDPHRFKIVIAGRGSGKSEIAKRFITVEAASKEGLYFYALPTYAQAKHVAWRDLQALALEGHLIKSPRSINRTDLEITYRNGSVLKMLGLDKAERAEGVQYRGGIIDEISDVEPEAFGLTFRPALTHYKGWCWRIGVPKSDGVGGSHIKEEFEKYLDNPSLCEKDDTKAYTWFSSTVLPPSEIEAAKRSLAPQQFREQYEASWYTSNNRVYYCFDAKANCQPKHLRAGSSHSMDLITAGGAGCEITAFVVGMDFNVSPMAWVIGRTYDDETVDILDEIFINDTNTEVCLPILEHKLRNLGWTEHHRLLICGDAASRQRKSSAAFSDYLQVSQYPPFTGQNTSIAIPGRNPAILDRVATTNMMLRTSSNEVRCYIDPGCKALIKDLTSLVYRKDQGRTIDLRNPTLGHISDAFGYLMRSLAIAYGLLKPEGAEHASALSTAEQISTSFIGGATNNSIKTTHRPHAGIYNQTARRPSSAPGVSGNRRKY